jgi:hypothetical protein
MVLIATRGANSTIIGAIRSMKSAALAVAFGSEANIGCGSDCGPCAVAGVRENAGHRIAYRPLFSAKMLILIQHTWRPYACHKIPSGVAPHGLTMMQAKIPAFNVAFPVCR